jgi:hypothetical protein
MQFNNLQQTSMMPQQGMLTIPQQMPMQSQQRLVQPMLTPLTGTNQQMLQTVQQQPGMMANQLPIAYEMGPQPQQPYGYGLGQLGMPLTSQQFMQQQPMMMTTQPMVTGMITQPTPMPMQPVVTGMIPTPQPQPMPTPPPQMPMQPVLMAPPPLPPLPPPPPPPPPPPVMQPVIQVPQLSPAQVAATQQIAAKASQPIGISGPGIGGIQAGGGAIGYGAGGGKAGPGAGGGISQVGPEGRLGYSFNVAAGPGIGNTGIGGLLGGFGPGAFDTHRPDLHAGGPWALLMPKGTENLFNLL